MVMLLSIPPIGGHYLVDVLAGGALALGAIAVHRAQRHGVNRILFGIRRERGAKWKWRYVSEKIQGILGTANQGLNRA